MDVAFRLWIKLRYLYCLWVVKYNTRYNNDKIIFCSVPLCQPDYCTNIENIFVFAVFQYDENVMVSVSSVVVR